MRSRLMWRHAPIVFKYWAEVGVRELHRFENWPDGRFQVRNLDKSWASTRATLRWDVAGLDPVRVQWDFSGLGVSIRPYGVR